MNPDYIVETNIETWPIAGEFVISRGSKREATVVVVHVSDGVASGRGECVPYARYGETADSVRSAIRAAALMGLDRTGLQRLAPAGAARNALDCALWDLEAKRTGKSAVVLAGLAPLAPVVTAYTISLGNAAAMAKAAAAAAAMPLLKIKLGGEGDAQRMRAVRAARPDARLIADANEAWTAAMLPELLAVAAETRFEVVEQPLPAGQDAALAHIARTVPICADESFRTADDLTRVAAHYDAVNIKLDKTGGLTAALELAGHARTLGLAVMVGCMVATSLSMAPALLLAQDADWVDLDGPLLLARDRSPSLRYEGAVVYPPEAALWG